VLPTTGLVRLQKYTAQLSVTVGGSVLGLGTGVQVTLKNNGGDALILSANGPFTFATPLAANLPYAVTVATQPVGQTCTIANPTGTTGTVNVNNIAVICSTTTFTIGGTVSGLPAGTSVTLLNNAANALTVTSNGSFFFLTPVAHNGSYAVTVGTQPNGGNCTVSNGLGTASTFVTNVTISCSPTSSALRLGTVSGVNLNLISPITVSGSTFYFLDQNGNGIAECGGADDQIDHIKLNNLFNGGKPTTQTANTATVSGYTLSLATQADVFSIRSQYNYASPPGWWGNNTTKSATFNCNFSTADLAGMYNATTGVHYNTYMGSNTGPANNPTGNGVFTNLYDGYGYNGLVAVKVTPPKTSQLTLEVMDITSVLAGTAPLLNSPFGGFRFTATDTVTGLSSVVTLQSPAIDNAQTYPQLATAFQAAIDAQFTPGSLVASVGSSFTVVDTRSGVAVLGQQIKISTNNAMIVFSTPPGSGWIATGVVPPNSGLHTQWFI